MNTAKTKATAQGTAPGTITLAKGGKDERTVNISQVHIPDLWHIAQHLDDIGIKTQGGELAGDLVRQVWHLAHDLKRELQERI